MPEVNILHLAPSSRLGNQLHGDTRRAITDVSTFKVNVEGVARIRSPAIRGVFDIADERGVGEPDHRSPEPQVSHCIPRWGLEPARHER